MASIFTYDPNPPRVSSPWSTPQSTTPKLDISSITSKSASPKRDTEEFKPQILDLKDVGITRLDPEPQEGPTEYKLHLLLRPRTSAAASAGVAALYGQDDSRITSTSRSPQLEAAASSLKLVSTPSIQTRQNRLHHLTTQLLWRLQQSSPFHSSSSANLVLPVLPDATPRLGIPSKPAQLLPGLEESQGALYEIGVADDGTFVGLTEDEMQESLNNIRAMAASLGCHVEVLRKVLVGRFLPSISPSSGDGAILEESLWVIEALVRPDLGARRENVLAPQTVGGSCRESKATDTDDVRQSRVEQIRVSLVGASAVGKSTLLGVLTSSDTDNGRGKSRLSLLKHRHEVSTGITSSVAQELIGYRKSNKQGSTTYGLSVDQDTGIINYGLSNVASWNDIHSMTRDGRLAFVSDSPGLPRFSKSTIRTLTSWKPHWTLFTISATGDADYLEGLARTKAPETESQPGTGATPMEADNVELSLAYLHLCLELELPLVVVMTKMDLATKAGLRAVLGQVLSTLKAAGRKPVILPSSNVMPGSTPPLSSYSPRGSNASVNSGHLIQRHLQDIDEVDSRDIASVVDPMRRNADALVVPIVLVSSVTSVGIGKLHALLRTLPLWSGSVISPAAMQNVAAVHPVIRPTTPDQTASFQVDEIFSMPVSKVFSPNGDPNSPNETIVVCGHLTSGSIGVGEELLLGPFGTIGDLETGQVSSNQEALLKARNFNHAAQAAADRTWAIVKVISIRNLRLPVRFLLAGQVGTLGIMLPHSDTGNFASLCKARRGMILTSLQVRNPPPVYTSFSAHFSLKDFEEPNSPPLIIGGQAVVYVNSIRAPVKVVAMERRQIHDVGPSHVPTRTNSGASGSAESQGKNEDDEGFFGFDSDELTPTDTIRHQRLHGTPEEGEIGEATVTIMFACLRWPESFGSGDKILVIPSPSGTFPSSTGVNGSSFPTTSLERLIAGDHPSSYAAIANGLAGFVGSIS